MSLESNSETPQGNFAEYKKHSGALSQQEYEAVMNADYIEDDYRLP